MPIYGPITNKPLAKAQATDAKRYRLLFPDHDKRSFIGFSCFCSISSVMIKANQTRACLADKFIIVSDNKYDFIFCKVLNQFANLLHAVIIKTRSWFIKNHQFLTAYHTNGYSNPLLLSSGKCVWMPFTDRKKAQII